MTHRNVPVCLVLTAALLAGLAVATKAEAGPKKPKMPFAPQVQGLRAVRGLLAHADRDYKGHRVAAMRSITAAIRTLRPARAAAKRGGAKAPKGNGEPQTLSDAQLKQAIADLAAIQTQLKGMNRPRPTKAAHATGVAIKELTIALHIR